MARAVSCYRAALGAAAAITAQQRPWLREGGAGSCLAVRATLTAVPIVILASPAMQQQGQQQQQQQRWAAAEAVRAAWRDGGSVMAMGVAAGETGGEWGPLREATQGHHGKQEREAATVLEMVTATARQSHPPVL